MTQKIKKRKKGKLAFNLQICVFTLSDLELSLVIFRNSNKTATAIWDSTRATRASAPVIKTNDEAITRSASWTPRCSEWTARPNDERWERGSEDDASRKTNCEWKMPRTRAPVVKSPTPRKWILQEDIISACVIPDPFRRTREWCKEAPRGPPSKKGGRKRVPALEAWLYGDTE